MIRRTRASSTESGSLPGSAVHAELARCAGDGVISSRRAENLNAKERWMLRGFYIVASALSLGNAGWMLLGPGSWFMRLPAALPDTGPYNGHLVRDFGVAFAVMGLALAWAARNPARARGVHLAVTAFLVGHALVHVADLLDGRLPHRHW